MGRKKDRRGIEPIAKVEHWSISERAWLDGVWKFTDWKVKLTPAQKRRAEMWVAKSLKHWACPYPTPTETTLPAGHLPCVTDDLGYPKRYHWRPLESSRIVGIDQRPKGGDIYIPYEFLPARYRYHTPDPERIVGLLDYPDITTKYGVVRPESEGCLYCGVESDWDFCSLGSRREFGITAASAQSKADTGGLNWATGYGPTLFYEFSADWDCTGVDPIRPIPVDLSEEKIAALFISATWHDKSTLAKKRKPSSKKSIPVRVNTRRKIGWRSLGPSRIPVLRFRPKKQYRKLWRRNRATVAAIEAITDLKPLANPTIERLYGDSVVNPYRIDALRQWLAELQTQAVAHLPLKGRAYVPSGKYKGRHRARLAKAKAKAAACSL